MGEKELKHYRVDEAGRLELIGYLDGWPLDYQRCRLFGHPAAIHKGFRSGVIYNVALTATANVAGAMMPDMPPD